MKLVSICEARRGTGLTDSEGRSIRIMARKQPRECGFCHGEIAYGDHYVKKHRSYPPNPSAPFFHPECILKHDEEERQKLEAEIQDRRDRSELERGGKSLGAWNKGSRGGRVFRSTRGLG